MNNSHHFIFRVHTDGTNELVHLSSCGELVESFTAEGARSLQFSNLMALTICPFCSTQLFIEVELETLHLQATP